MRKIFAISLSVLQLFSLVACGGKTSYVPTGSEVQRPDSSENRISSEESVSSEELASSKESISTDESVSSDSKDTTTTTTAAPTYNEKEEHHPLLGR